LTTVRRAEALDEIERSVGRISRIGSSVAASRTRAARAGVDVLSPGMGVLGVLDRAGPLRVSAVATMTGMVGTLVSREIRALERTGLVTRSSDRSDGRAVIVSLTPAGRESYRRLRQASVEAAGLALAGWNMPELVTLAGLLARVADDFAAVADRAAPVRRASSG
jgi:DNA-binding MarR family transcriptional regulator